MKIHELHNLYNNRQLDGLFSSLLTQHRTSKLWNYWLFVRKILWWPVDPSDTEAFTCCGVILHGAICVSHHIFSTLYLVCLAASLQCLTASSHYLNQCWHITKWKVGSTVISDYIWNSTLFFCQNALKSVVYIILAILLRPHCTKANSVWIPYAFHTTLQRPTYFLSNLIGSSLTVQQLP